MRVKVRVWFSNCARCVLVVEYALSGCALGFVDVEGGVPGRFEQTEYIQLHAVYEPVAHRPTQVRTCTRPRCNIVLSNVAGECSGSSLSLLCGLYAIYGDDFQINQVGGLRLDMLNVCTWSLYQQISTSGSGVCNISSYILLVLDNARLPPVHHTLARIASSLISNRILKLELYSIGKDLIGR